MPRLTPVAAMQLSQKNQKLALAAAAGVAAALVIRRKLRTKIRAAFDIGSGVLTSISEIVTILANLLNKDENLVIEDAKRYRGDIQIQSVAINFVPGFSPRYTVAQGLKKMLSSMSY